MDNKWACKWAINHSNVYEKGIPPAWREVNNSPLYAGMSPEPKPHKAYWHSVACSQKWSSSVCRNPTLLALFLDTTVNQKLILRPENAEEGILVLFFFFSISELCSPADTGGTRKRGEQKISFSGLSPSLTWCWVTTSWAVIRTGFPTPSTVLEQAAHGSGGVPVPGHI